jgi:hypothetical protein
MLSRAADVGLLTPANQTVSTIGAALCAHWAIAKAATRAQFWAKPQNWLNVPRHYLNRVTTSR